MNIGRYVGINYRNSRNALAGCINDVTDATKTQGPVLDGYDVLLEQEATKAAIIRFLRSGLKLLKPGDWLFVHFSGHGTQVPDRNSDEDDRYDEAFCPYDLDKNLLFDDELALLFSERVPGSNVLFVSDCCHSGTLGRGVRKQRVGPRFIPFEMISANMSHRHRVQLEANQVQSRTAVSRDIFHLSGCKDDEVSYDATFNGRANGALTHLALQAWRELDKGCTFFDWYKRIRALFAETHYDQTPQFSGPDWVTQTIPGFELTPPPPAMSPIVDHKPAQPPDVKLTVGDWESTRIEWRKRAA